MPEHVEKIHEFSLRVQNDAKSRADSASGCGMTHCLCVNLVIKVDKSLFLNIFNRDRQESLHYV